MSEDELIREINNLKDALKIAKDNANKMYNLSIQSEGKHKYILSAYNKLEQKSSKDLLERENVMLEMTTMINDLVKYKEEKYEIEAIKIHIIDVVKNI